MCESGGRLVGFVAPYSHRSRFRNGLLRFAVEALSVIERTGKICIAAEAGLVHLPPGDCELVEKDPVNESVLPRS